MAKKQRNWEGRLETRPADAAVQFVESLSFDTRLYKYDIAGSIAHCRMLAERKLITQKEFNRIKKGLLDIEKEIAGGKFRFDKTYEDIHMAIEAALIKKIGEVGKKMHTGRSRNDQVGTDLRLWMRDEIEVIRSKIAGLQKALVNLAERYKDDVMPAYTHLQRAQPVVIAAYLLSFVEQFERDYIRLGSCRGLLNVSPLGSGAIAGSGLGIDRDSTARQLGFCGVSANSIDAVSDRDFCADFIFDCAIVAMHLSRLAEDWIIFSTNEFDYIRIDDRYCTGSSMMPQKRNPDILELIRAKAGRVYGALVGILTIMKALPTGYNRDLQEDKIYIFGTSDTIEQSLDIAAAVVQNSTFNIGRIKIGIDDGFLDATALAEYLVRKGIAFRQAHSVVGQIVRYCERTDKQLGELSLKEFNGFCSAIGRDVYNYLGALNVVRNYVTAGSGGPGEAKKQIAFWRKELAKR